MVDRWAPPHTTVVTGAAGWLGQALVHRLIDDPARQVVRVNVLADADRAMIPQHPKVELVQVGDLSVDGVAAALLADVSSDTDVIHAAGIIHPAVIADFHRVNTVGTQQVVDATVAAGVRRLVHVSSNSPFGTNPQPTDRFRADEPYNPYLGYGQSKMQGELAVIAAVMNGLDATIVRPPWFYGPFQPPRQTTFFRMVRNGKFPVIAGGRQQRSMVYVENLVDGVLAAELTPAARGRGYWIADARPYEVREIVETVGRALVDEGFSVKPGALKLPAIAGRVAETADRLIQRAGRYQQQLHVLGEMDKTIACDISASQADLGYDPQIELYEGMRRSIRWCVENRLEL
jgi:nucleoside-diphosphate-sugar epimerase